MTPNSIERPYDQFCRLPGGNKLAVLGEMRAIERPQRREPYLRSGLRAAYAFEKALHYMVIFDEINDNRASMTRTANLAVVRYQNLYGRRADWSEAYVEAIFQWERLEAVWHLWIVMANQIGNFLTVIRRCFAISAKQETSKYWADLADARHEFEHINDRIEGHKWPERLQYERTKGETVSFYLGRMFDSEGRLELGNVTVDITDRGFYALRDRITAEFTEIEERCKEMARDLLSRCPASATALADGGNKYSRFLWLDQNGVMTAQWPATVTPSTKPVERMSQKLNDDDPNDDH